MARCNLTQKRLKELLHYDPETGVFTWRITRGSNAVKGTEAGAIDGEYLRIKIDGKSYRAHRLAILYVTGKWPPHDVDHKNHAGTDNSLGNLRPATEAQNMKNRKLNRNSTSGYKGVTWNKKDQRWWARIMVSGKSKFLGRFNDPETAHAAYCAAADALHGEFANHG